MKSKMQKPNIQIPITGEYIKALRIESGLSQTELAKFANVSQAHIAKIESGKVDPRLSTINRILLVLSKKERVIKRCKDIMSRVMYVKPDTPVKKVVEIMKDFGFSQVPVIEKDKPIGSISEETLMRNMGRNLMKLNAKDICDKAFPVVDANENIDILPSLLELSHAVLVSEKGRIVGIITKSDLLGIK